VISNTSAFMNQLTTLPATLPLIISALWTFATTPIIQNLPINPTDAVNKAYVDSVAIAGAPKADAVTFGIVKMTVAPAVALTPIAVGDNDGRIPTQGENDALVGDNTSITVGTGNKFVTQTGLQNLAETFAVATGAPNTYAITLSPVPTAYVAGQEFAFQANFANTGTATLNVNGLGAKTIMKINGVTVLAIGDIASGQVVKVKYDGTNFQMLNPVAIPPLTVAPVYANGITVKNAADAVPSTQNIAHGLGKIPKYVRLTASTVTGGGTAWPTAFAVYNGSVQSSISTVLGGSGFAQQEFRLNMAGAGSPGGQVATITFDATNIILSWSGGTASGFYNILWEAMA
jgi:hypothetical protein